MNRAQMAADNCLETDNKKKSISICSRTLKKLQWYIQRQAVLFGSRSHFDYN